CRERKACPRPSETYTVRRRRSSSTTASHVPNVGEPTLMSTTTSNTDPRRQVTYLAWLGGTWAKCTPRSTPAADTQQLACTGPSRCPANSVNPESVNHSKNRPRESVCTCGVISHAPGTANSRAVTGHGPRSRPRPRLSVGATRIRCRDTTRWWHAGL